MALLRYLGGLAGKLIGVILIIFGLLTAFVNVGVCFAFVIIGVLFVLIGKFYSTTAKRYTPVKIQGGGKRESSSSSIPEGRPCPDCGTPMRYIKDHDSWYCENCNQYKTISPQQKTQSINQQSKRSKQPPPPPEEDTSRPQKTEKEKLEELREMKEDGLISDEEFREKKKEILDNY